jgi:hypothetical protein
VSLVHFSSMTTHWATPKALYDALNEEFRFTMDACPLGGMIDSLLPWAKQRVYCNPPYGRACIPFLRRAREADLSVYLLKSDTSTGWWHDYVMQADEIRFIRGRVRFQGAKGGPAPFPSAIAIYGRAAA